MATKVGSNSAYIRVFDEVLTFATRYNYNLFDSNELSTLAILINLTNSDKYLLSRLALRRVKWIRLSSIAHYIQSFDDSDDESHGQDDFDDDGHNSDHEDGGHNSGRLDLSRTLANRNGDPVVSHSPSYHKVNQHSDHQQSANSIIDRLDQLNIISVLHNKSTFDQAYEAIQSCFKLPELILLLKSITKNKSTNTLQQMMLANSSNNNGSSGSNSSGTRCNRTIVLASIKSNIMNQRTMFGELLSTKFAKIVLDLLKTLPNITTTTSTVTTNVSNTYTGATKQQQNSRSKVSPSLSLSSLSTSSSVDRVICINEPVLHLYRRCQRLYQISAHNTQSNYSSSSKSNQQQQYRSNYRTSSSTINTASSSSSSNSNQTDHSSILVPLEFNAPLMVLFRKVKYPAYAVHPHRPKPWKELSSTSIVSPSLPVPLLPPVASLLSPPSSLLLSSPPSSSSTTTTLLSSPSSLLLPSHVWSPSLSPSPSMSVIFPSRGHFIRWEASVELYLACFSKVDG